jgi:HTH-type transcriptional regulator, competence development regulator
MTFGQTIRGARLASDISLRELARAVNVSASYLSRVENDCVGGKAGPTEAMCVALAHTLELNADTLIALAGRVPSDVSEIIRSDPVRWTQKIRSNK